MKVKLIVVSLLISSLVMIFPQKSGAWNTLDHRILASEGEQCVSLPKPPKTLIRCILPVDEIILKTFLRIGSVEPDKKDGWSSTKHAFNPEYEINKAIWDPKIREELGMPNAQINAGAAIETIGEEIEITKGLLDNIKRNYCNSTLWDFAKLWYQFGRLSHYPADIAVPLHVYRVNAEDIYHEGDLGLDGNWYKGIWESGMSSSCPGIK